MEASELKHRPQHDRNVHSARVGWVVPVIIFSRCFPRPLCDVSPPPRRDSTVKFNVLQHPVQVWDADGMTDPLGQPSPSGWDISL